MKLEKPIIWFDIESTGVDTESDKICQIAAIKITPDGKKETKDVLINPEIPIPEGVTAVHGITNEMIKNAPTFKQLSRSMRDWFKDCDLGGFNSNNYDIPLLSAEFERAELEGINWNPNLVDVYKLYLLLYPNTLGEIYKRILGKELDGAHNALIDIQATIDIINHITEEEEDLQSPIQIDNFIQGDKKRFDLNGKMYIDEDGIVKWNFSKNKDTDVKSDKGFQNWFFNQNFPKESKDKLKQHLYG